MVLSIIVEIGWEVHDIALKGLAYDDANLLRTVHDKVKPLKDHKISLVFDVSLRASLGLNLSWER